MSDSMNYRPDRLLATAIYFMFYFIVFASFGFSHMLLSQVQPIFFNYNRDLSELFIISTGLPRWMIAHPGGFLAADLLLFILPVALLLYFSLKDRFSPLLGSCFTVYLILYFLLADIFIQSHNEPYVMYFLLSFLFITNRPHRFYQILTVSRYYFLYIFCSAALWKISRGAIFNGMEMSNILIAQHSNILYAPCTSWSCRFYHYLIDHPVLSYILYLGGVALEASFLIGYFTRRWDRWLVAVALLFFLCDQLVMRIAYWTMMAGAVTLLVNSGKRAMKLVIYETTHHENLPALLDLSEACFAQTAIFLKKISYDNLSSMGEPAILWPRTEFFVQPEDCSNRAFISRTVRYLREHRCSHFHISTLDNNLLFFAGKILSLRGVHISLTVHEINEYTSSAWRDLRDLTESIAKKILRRRIRHYSFFLPSMAALFEQKMPGTVAVFIPSRFYRRTAAGGISGAVFKIVIPGSVEANRRDYAFVSDFMDYFLSRGPLPGQAPLPDSPGRRPIELVILGNSRTEYGLQVTGRLRKLESAVFKISAYDTYIPQQEYERQLASADLIWSPLLIHKLGIRLIAEVCGQSTASGLTADLLLNNTPALVPQDFVPPEHFREALLSYNSRESLKMLLVRCMDDPAWYLQLRQTIHQSFSFFTKEHFAESFAKLMDPHPAYGVDGKQDQAT